MGSAIVTPVDWFSRGTGLVAPTWPVAYGGLDTGSDWDPQSQGLLDVDFTWDGLRLLVALQRFAARSR